MFTLLWSATTAPACKAAYAESLQALTEASTRHMHVSPHQCLPLLSHTLAAHCSQSRTPFVCVCVCGEVGREVIRLTHFQGQSQGQGPYLLLTPYTHGVPHVDCEGPCVVTRTKPLLPPGGKAPKTCPHQDRTVYLEECFCLFVFLMAAAPCPDNPPTQCKANPFSCSPPVASGSGACTATCVANYKGGYSATCSKAAWSITGACLQRKLPWQ
jgi:hypothetical protein